ncbi:MAG: exopolysaccharide biosynthesis polyprenyl glycosylphosphotransferase [Phycisphaerae bacterium]
MCAQIAAGVDGSGVAAPVLADFPARRSVNARTALGSAGERLTRVIGRALLRLPASTWLVLDLSLLTLGTYVAHSSFPPPELLVTPHIALWQALAVFAFSAIVCSLVFGLYDRETLMSRSRIFTRMLLTTGAACVLSYAMIYVVMYAIVGRRFTTLAMSVYLGGGVAVRLGAWWAVHKVHCGLLVIGSRALYESLKTAQENGFLHEYRLVGYASARETEDDGRVDTAYLGPILQDVGGLGTLGVTDIVVGESDARARNVMEWMVPCLQAGCRVTNEAIFYEKATGQILVDEITPSWFLFADLRVHCDEHATLKRLADLVLAGAGLCLSAPLWPLIGLAIKLGDGGPVFYSQDRVGENGRVFRLFKFRTMKPDAENGKSVWCAPNDPRVTRIGQFLRRTRLDELPQLYNVLVGQMSLVGPRPERPDFVEQLCDRIPYYAERHLVKPGITGWAQISYRYGSSIEDAKRKLQYDLYYLKHMSFELDMMILFRTAGTFLRGAC